MVNSDHHTQKITISKKTVKITNSRDDVEYPKAVKKEGKYILPWKCDENPPDGMAHLKYFFTLDDSKVPNEKKLNEEPLMQLMTADPSRVENPPENGVRVTWLGHASALFQFDNVNILLNPNFNQRGTKYYYPTDNRRYRSPVYKVDDLPRIDCVFITNTHFDYLDLGSVRSLNDRFGEMLLWYVPMGVADWMGKAGCVNVVELDWWKEDEVDFIDHHTKVGEEDEDTKTTMLNIVCTPSQNYHSRNIDDDNGVLWCSWVVVSPRYKLYFAGATGYNDKVFKAIGRRYGPFHMAALPIGGYCPSWKNAYGNVTPEQAVQLHQDVLATCSLALSWGTFQMSTEYYLEPPQKLNDELKKQGLSEMQFFLLKHGESRLIEVKEAEKDDAESADHEHGHVGGHVDGHVEAVSNGHAHVDKDEHAELKGDFGVTATIHAGGEMNVTVNDIPAMDGLEIRGEHEHRDGDHVEYHTEHRMEHHEEHHHPEHHAENGTEHNAGNGTEHHAEIGTEHHAENGTEHHAENGTQHHAENGAEQHAENGTEHHAENGTEHHAENGTEHHAENGTEHHAEIGTEHRAENGTEHRAENGTEHHAENGAEQHAENGAEQHAENGTEEHHAENGTEEHHAENGTEEHHAENVTEHNEENGTEHHEENGTEHHEEHGTEHHEEHYHP